MPTKQHCATHDVEHVASAFASPRSRVCKKASKERARRNARSARLMREYGITLEEYEALLEAQGSCCAVCGGKRRYNLHVDHDHARQRELIEAGYPPMKAARLSVRGLLCARCNKLLRDARDNGVLFANILRYLKRPPAWRVLRASGGERG